MIQLKVCAPREGLHCTANNSLDDPELHRQLWRGHRRVRPDRRPEAARLDR
jgi:hypothetical protein